MRFIAPLAAAILKRVKIPETTTQGVAAQVLRLRRAILEQLYLSIKLRDTSHYDCGLQAAGDKMRLDLVTVAFNSPTTIKYQIRLLEKYLKDSYVYTVADNSSNPEAAHQIQELCRQSGTGYIKLPPSPYPNPSSNHGMALNWLLHNYLLPRGAAYIGFLDHDIFPVRPTRLIPDIKPSGFYGRLQVREDKWYLWPGFCFYGRDLEAVRQLNFLPATGMDTGGSNWPILYHNYAKPPFADLPTTYKKLRPGSDPQTDLVEYFGDWMHTINASSWKPAKGKGDLVEELLAKL